MFSTFEFDIYKGIKVDITYMKIKDFFLLLENVETLFTMSFTRMMSKTKPVDLDTIVTGL